MSTVTLELRPDTEQKLREKAARTGQTIEGLLLQAAERLAIEETIPLTRTAAELTPAQRAAAWREWVASHKPLPIIADDSRESIYEGRGE